MKIEEQERPDVLEIVENADAPAIYNEQGRAKALVDAIRESALAIVPDAETAKGRKEIKSCAYAVARCKTTLDGIGKDMVADLKEKVKRVDVRRKYIRDELDALKEEVLGPVTDWENRIREAEETFQHLHRMQELPYGATARDLASRLDAVQALAAAPGELMGRDDEFAEKAAEAEDKVVAALEERRKFEADQEELRKLREEREKRDREEAARKAEEERKAREAEIRAEAEAKAKAEVEEKARAEASAASTAPAAPDTPTGAENATREIAPPPAPPRTDARRAIEDALMDEIDWMMPDKAADIAEAICGGLLPGVEVRA